MSEQCTSIGSGELISCFAFLEYAASALPVNLSLSQLMGFLVYILLTLLDFGRRGVSEGLWGT